MTPPNSMTPLDKALAIYEQKRAEAITAFRSNDKLMARYAGNLFAYYGLKDWMDLFEGIENTSQTWPLNNRDMEMFRIAEPVYVAAKVVTIIDQDGPDYALQFKLQWRSK